MADNAKQSIFREKSIRPSSPDQLNDYLRVTSPGVWAVLAAVILLMAGTIAWATVGTLETTEKARILVEEETALIVSEGTTAPEAGMLLRVAGQEYSIVATQNGEYGQTLGVAQVSLPDGAYDAELVIEQIHPIRFLLESR